jgi:FMN reductase
MSGASIDVAVVVGNPKPASRTLIVAEEVARVVAEAIEMDGLATTTEIIDLGAFGPAMLDSRDEEVASSIERAVLADVLIAASPTYKATYTGLLKLFFDRMANRALAGTVAVPIMVGAGPAHSMAIEHHFRPLLVELGASCPTPGLYVMEPQLEHLPEVLVEWMKNARASLVGQVMYQADAGENRRLHHHDVKN